MNISTEPPSVFKPDPAAAFYWTDLNAGREYFLSEMLAYYAADERRRGMYEDACRYRAPNGTMCSIGRIIPDAEYIPGFEGSNVWDLAIFGSLPPAYQMLGREFLKEVQQLHDSPSYWGSWEDPAGKTREANPSILRQDKADAIRWRHIANKYPYRTILT